MTRSTTRIRETLTITSISFTAGDHHSGSGWFAIKAVNTAGVERNLHPTSERWAGVRPGDQVDVSFEPVVEGWHRKQPPVRLFGVCNATLAALL